MTIIEFYQRLSDMLERARSGKLSKEDGLKRLDQMTQEMRNHGIEVNISREIFNFDNLVKFDDERSYEEIESSYDGDDEYFDDDLDTSYDPY